MLAPRRRDFVAILLPVLSGCRRPARQRDPLLPVERSDGWEIGRLKDAGFDEIALQKVTADLKSGVFPNTHAVLVEHDGRLVYEQYFAGRDERWTKSIGRRVMDAGSLHDLRSVSKSVTAALLGIALGADFEKALASPIASFFPQLNVRRELDALTLHHALTMTAGLEWNEMTVPYTDPNNDEMRLYSVKDPVAMVLSRALRQKPGAVWYYNGGLTQVLAGVVRQITGKTPDAYAKQVLFGPLGITQYEWIGGPGWNPPMPAAASGLRMRARDLAKFGSVYLHGGKWQGRQIVPAAWVERSMRRHVASIGDWSRGGMWGYGYQWWVGRFSEGYEVAAAVGNGNQRVFVAPKERVAVTVFAGEYNVFEGHSERVFRSVMAARTAA
jgi:CubicO group peptidase (beta-lactamase class C family)